MNQTKAKTKNNTTELQTDTATKTAGLMNKPKLKTRDNITTKTPLSALEIFLSMCYINSHSTNFGHH